MSARFFIIYLVIGLSVLNSCGESSPSEKAPDRTTEILLFMVRDWNISNVLEVHGNSKHNDPLLAEAEDQSILEQGFKLFVINDTLLSILEGAVLKHYRYTIDQKKVTFYLRELNGKSEKHLIVKDMREGRHGKILTINYNDEATYELAESGAPLVNDTEHPYYPKNNLWRIPAHHAESVPEIKSRLLNLVKHNLYILKTASIRNARTVDFTYSNGIIKIYNGGIGAIPIDYIPRYWRETFYNSKQAVLAHDIFRNYLRSLNYHGAHGDGWVETDYNILLALYKKIDLDLGSKDNL